MKPCKSELRNKYKSIRRSERSAFKDEKICRSVLEYIKSEDADIIFIYCSSDTEINTLEIIESALENGVKVALPRCSDGNGAMDFYIISDVKEDLVKGMFSLMEPDTERCSKVTGSERSLCIVPGLAFDRTGYRIGYGKGYYDRFLSRFKGKSIGLSYSACLCDELPFDKYDRKVDVIITENEIINLR